MKPDFEKQRRDSIKRQETAEEAYQQCKLVNPKSPMAVAQNIGYSASSIETV